MSALRPAYRVTTPRLLMRPWSPEDAPLLRALLDRSDHHFRPYIPWMRDEPKPLAGRRMRTVECYAAPAAEEIGFDGSAPRPGHFAQRTRPEKQRARPKAVQDFLGEPVAAAAARLRREAAARKGKQGQHMIPVRGQIVPSLDRSFR